MEAIATATSQTAAINRMAVLIPARRWEPGLPALVDALLDARFGAIVLVNDGIPIEDKPSFQSLADRTRVHLLHHAVNLGKGRALKTGINYFLTAFPNFVGLVTADSDGQHSVADIVAVAHTLLAAPRRVVLGCRSFTGRVPLRSRFGNDLTRLIFHLVSGHKVSDTQTGLRAFPKAILPDLTTLRGERYEYEMTVLAHLCCRGYPLVELPISTIYIDGNRSSHFSPVRDSVRIYFVLLRFYASSLISAAIDFAGFGLTFWITHNVLLSMITGRLGSLVNFVLNRQVVFHSGVSAAGSLARYCLLALAIAIVSYGLITSLASHKGWNILAAKLIVDTALSLASFSIQRTFVFPHRQGG
jgi:glycosyltransferase involved in cell wall biosynthesis